MPKQRTSPVLNTGYCEYCGETLVQRETEPYCNWIKRRTCDKKHAALNKQQKIREAKIVTPLAEALCGVKRYVKGTAEFEAIASLYK